MFSFLIALYVVFCAAVYFFPQYFFYKPSSLPSNVENARMNGFPAKEVHYRSADGTGGLAWYVKPAVGKKIILFFHGNSHNLESFYYKLIPFVSDGYGVFMPEYRGFGGLKGKIRQSALEKDALAALEYLYGLGYQNKDIVVYGLSLGSHMAINSIYAYQKKGDFAALVLEVPFNSMEEVVRAIVPIPFPLKWIIRDKYENREMLSRINTPLLITAGSEDRLVPAKLARDLFNYAGEPKKIIIYQGASHNNLYNFKNYADILKWLEDK